MAVWAETYSLLLTETFYTINIIYVRLILLIAQLGNVRGCIY